MSPGATRQVTLPTDLHMDPAAPAERAWAEEPTQADAEGKAEPRTDDDETHRVGVYRLVRPLGRGGMGEVFLAWDERLKRNVAIKRIRLERADDDGSRGRFRREARAVAQLSHPAIVQIFDVLESPDGDSIVMEYVEGKSLVQAIATTDLDLLAVVRLAGEIAAGLGEAHDKGLVHRDLKPENVMLTGPRPRAKILDFGLARALHKDILTNESGDSLTTSGAVVGTAYAMSPEQAAGKSVDHRSDLFALGNLIYQTLSGTAPFRGEGFLDTLERVKSHQPPPICDLRPDVPATLDALVMKLLVKDPAGRPQSAHRVEAELRRIGLALETGMPATPGTPANAELADLSTLEGAMVSQDMASGPDADADGHAESNVETVVRTLVLTDLVDSTRLVESLGDYRASEVFARHDRVARDLLERHHGLEIDKSDGFLLLFERPFDAIAYTIAYHRALVELSNELDVHLAARAGVHLGEVVLRRNKRRDVERGAKPVEVEGLAKPTAARLMSLAGARQTLLSRSAFDLGRRAALDEERWDENLRWLAHGNYVVKGVDELLEVFEVGVGDFAPLVAPADSEKARRAVTVSDELVLGWRPAAGQPIPRRPHWTLAERLGEGGFGEVWLARHKSGESRMFKFCFEAERLRALKREVTLFRLLKEALGHRDDITRILDWNFDAAPYFLEAEYTEGGDLAEWASEQGGLAKVPLPTRLELVAEVAEALSAAHSVGILHKDVKPENVLIATDRDGQPRARLTDFGIGLITDQERLEVPGVTVMGFTETITSTDSSAGTLRYLAPELLEGKPATIQADVYSLGVMLYQIVVGDFSRALAPGWRREVEDELLAEDIACFVDGEAARRPRSALEVAEQLRSLESRRARLEAERGAREEAEAARRALERAYRRRRISAGVAAVVSFVLVLVSIFAVQAHRAREVADLRRDQAEDLISFMLGDLRGKLEPVGRLEILDAVGDQALQYFASVPEDDLTDEELFRRSKALVQIGEVRIAQGSLDLAADAFAEALELARSLVERDPDNASWRAGLGENHYWLGLVAWYQDDLATAMEWFQGYRATAELLVEKDPEDPRWRLELAHGHSNVGTVLENMGDLTGALRQYRFKMELNAGLLFEDPANQKFRKELAASYSMVARTLEKMWNLEGALENGLAELQLKKTLASEDPLDVQFQEGLAFSHYRLCRVLLKMEKDTEALEHCRADLAILQGLAAKDPTNVEWQKEMALCRDRLGIALAATGQFEAALAEIRPSLSVMETLVAQDPQKTLWQRQLADIYKSHAEVLMRSGSLDAALSELDKAVALFKPLADDTQNRHALKGLSQALTLEGQIRMAMDRTEEAREAWNLALELIATVEKPPGELEWLGQKALILLYLGYLDEARPIVEKLLRGSYREREFLTAWRKSEMSKGKESR